MDQSIPGETARLSAFVSALSLDDLPLQSIRNARRHLLDTLVAMAAGLDSDTARHLAATAHRLKSSGPYRWRGHDQSFDILASAHFLGSAAHALEVDDGYRAGSVHPGAPVIPAVLLAAQETGASDADVLAAIVAGYEVVGRVARAVHPASRHRGFHNTSIVGPLGAAAAVARLNRTDAAEVEQAIAIAASSAAGLFAFLHGGGEVKRIHAGNAARAGLDAAALAAAGMTGPKGVLEGCDGFLQAYAGTGRPEELTKGLGDGLVIDNCYMKPYACCRHLHPGIDGVLALRREAGLAPDQIARVEIGTYAIAKGHAEGGWSGMASAQMNYRYCVAAALLFDRLGTEEFTPDRLISPEIEDLSARVDVTDSQRCESEYPRLRSAEIRLVSTTGQSIETHVDEPLGSAVRPLDDAALTAKARMLAGPVLGEAATDMLVAQVMCEGDETGQLSGVLSLLADALPQGPRGGV